MTSLRMMVDQDKNQIPYGCNNINIEYDDHMSFLYY